MTEAHHDLDTSRIKEWRSIITLIVFVLTNLIVLFPFHVPIYIPRILWDFISVQLKHLRIIPRSRPPRKEPEAHPIIAGKYFVVWPLLLNFVTAPFIADLFLIAISAIGRQEVHDGTVGADNISPLDIMVFFISLAYIAISIDASGLIRYLAYRVLQWGRQSGGKLFFYLYCFFFLLTSFIGNDPVILSGTAFLAYMTRVASNIHNRTAWIHTQFAAANIGSAILVSSNPTNLVLAGAFDIKFVHYTVNMVVPVVVTAIVLFPSLLWIIFADKDGVPDTIEIHGEDELPESLREPLNPNIPGADDASEDSRRQLQEVLHPWSDTKSAVVGAGIMAITLITLLALNAANEVHQVFWITLPAAFVMFCWDMTIGWLNREETRQIAEQNRRDAMQAEAESNEQADTTREVHERDPEKANFNQRLEETQNRSSEVPHRFSFVVHEPGKNQDAILNAPLEKQCSESAVTTTQSSSEYADHKAPELCNPTDTTSSQENKSNDPTLSATFKEPRSLVSRIEDGHWWLRKTFPAAMTVLAHLPFALVPFALSMFVLVQALVTKGWVPVFAYGWDHWVKKAGTIGAIGGMGFLSVVLCNFAGTNIGTAILLSRVVQAWQQIHRNNGIPISNRTFWATVYSMALGVNYGAFSAAFSASLAGLLWRDILRRKKIEVLSRDFARVNLPIIAIAMTVGCLVLVGEVYIFRDESPYNP